jgi:hypothetical protein
MATGEQTGYFDDVDGHQARHWQVPSGPDLPVGAMSAQLEPAQVLSVSCADLRALDLIGYEIADCLVLRLTLDPRPLYLPLVVN